MVKLDLRVLTEDGDKSPSFCVLYYINLPKCHSSDGVKMHTTKDLYALIDYPYVASVSGSIMHASRTA